MREGQRRQPPLLPFAMVKSPAVLTNRLKALEDAGLLE
jgi:hypothetical protein